MSLGNLIEENELDGPVEQKFAFFSANDTVPEDCAAGSLLCSCKGVDPYETLVRYINDFYNKNKRYPKWAIENKEYFYLILDKRSPMVLDNANQFSETIYVELSETDKGE